jgi:uncharacterized alpha-E superfamily protein
MEVISMQRGGLSKDTWVRSAGPVHHASMLKKRLGVIDLLYNGADVPSRVGETLFWMGRYAERCESSSRILRAALARVAGADADPSQHLASLVGAARRIGALPDQDDPGTASLESQLLRAVSDLTQPGSVAANLRGLAANANRVRERLSSDNWHALNRLEQALHPAPSTVDQALAALDQVMLGCIALAGFAMDDMTRDEGWRFLILGRRIERLAGISALVAVPLQAPEGERERMFEWLLEAANSIVTYRARYRRVPELLPVVHLLVFDASNPHAVAFQVDALRRYLDSSARELRHPTPPLMDSINQRLCQFDLTQFEAESCDAACTALAELLVDAERTAFAVSDEVHRRFFIHTVRPARRRRAA